MSVFQDNGPLAFHRNGWLAIALLAGLVLPMILWAGFPLLGAAPLEIVPLPKLLVLLTGGAVGVVSLLWFCNYSFTKPPVTLLLFMGVYLPLVVYINNLLIANGINIHLRLFQMLILSIPVVLVFLRYSGKILQDLPFLKYFLATLGLLTFYCLFYNNNIADANISGKGSLLEGSMSFIKLVNFYMALTGIIVGWLSFYRSDDKATLFDRFNRHLIWVTTGISIISLIGYPFNMFSTVLDGYHRSMGLAGHPSLYCSHLGIIMVYLVNLFCYYQGENKHRMQSWILYWGLSINFLGFLITFSKTGLAAFTVCAILLLFINIRVPAVRQAFLRGGVLIITASTLGAILFSSVSEQSITEVIMKRIEDTNSLSSRQSRWRILLDDIDAEHLIFGHGISAASGSVLEHSYGKDEGKASIAIHNGYLELLYDFGLAGYIFFFAILTTLGYAIRRLWQNPGCSENSLMAGIIAVTFYYLIEMAFDEVMMMFDICILYWLFLTILFCTWISSRKGHFE